MTLAIPSPSPLITPRASPLTPCAHCGLPVPAAFLEPAAKDQFCCQGCRTVFDVIHTCRMDQYYTYFQQDRQAGGTPIPARITGKLYAEFDDPAFLDFHAPLSQDRTRTIEFYLESVHCAACVWLVEKLPALLPSVLESRLNLGKGLVRITWLAPQDSAHRTRGLSLSRIARTLDSLGYPPHPARSSTARQVRTLSDRRAIIRIGVAGACAGNTMLLAAALYAGMFASGGGMDPACVFFFRYLSALIGLVALLWPGSVFFRGAWAALRTRTPHLDLPIALALLAGGLAGAINTLRGAGDIYFDSLSVLVLLLLVGRFLQQRMQATSDEAVELLFSLAPMSARRVHAAGTVTDVPISALQIGDIVEVRAGESVPVDGTLLPGFQTTADESLLTGESLPKTLAPGEPMHAGTTNISSPVRLLVQATGLSTRVGKLMHLVTQAARRRAPIVLLADRIAAWFLRAVLLIAAAVLAFWLLHGSARALGYAATVLIVACPCALALATPLAVSVAIGRAARRGILIKGGDALERLARPGLLLLDKTGTLTTAQMTLHLWHGDPSAQPLIAAIQTHSSHPLARAFCNAFPLAQTLCATNTTQEPAGGISGTVSGRHLLIGSPAFIAARAHVAPHWHALVDQCVDRGLTPVLIAEGHSVIAAAGFGDTLRPDAPSALRTLRKQGWQIGILSGDHPAIVQRIAQRLNIPPHLALGALTPEQKLAHVRAAALQRPVVMVGDGVNDAAALAAATVGIAVHGGAEASLAAAGIYLTKPGLSPIAEVVFAARATVRVIHRSLCVSILYNCLAISLAAVGLINPLAAAILMPISSLAVLSLTLGARTFSAPRPSAVPAGDRP